MKKYLAFFYFILPGLAYAQTCRNCGVNQNDPQASLHVKGCGSSNSTFGFKVSNGLNNTGLFVHDDLKVGIGAQANTYKLEVSDTAVSSGVQAIMRIVNRYTASDNNGAQLLFGANRSTSGMTNIAGISGVITDVSSSAYKGALVFSTANNAIPSERLRIDNNGNVGVGTASPTAHLEIVHRYDNASSMCLLLNQSAATWGTVPIYNAYRYIYTRSSATDSVSSMFKTFNVGAGGVSIGYYVTPSYGSGDALYVNGHVGLGTPVPQKPLHVESNAEWGVLMRSNEVNGSLRNHILIQRSLNYGAVTSNTNLGGIGISGSDGTNYYSGWDGGAEISGFATENWTSTQRGAALVFQTTENGNNYVSQRMRIDHNGNVGIGTTSPNSKLETAGSFGAGIHYATSNYTASDETVILVNAASNTTITLPPASGVERRIYIIKRVNNSGYTCTIDANGSETIDGNLNKLLNYLESVTIVAFGGNWWIVQ